MLFKTPLLAFTFSTSFTRGNWSGLRMSRGHCFFKTTSWVDKDVSKWKHVWQFLHFKALRLCHFVGWKLPHFPIQYSPFCSKTYDVGPRRQKHKSGEELPESKASKGFWKNKRPILAREFLGNPTKPTKRMESLCFFDISYFFFAKGVSVSQFFLADTWPLCLFAFRCPRSNVQRAARGALTERSCHFSGYVFFENGQTWVRISNIH